MFDCLSQIYYLVDPDIASNKPADASSTHNNNRNQYGPQYVNNEKANCADPRGPIPHTKPEASPWFKVDLQGTFNIKTVVVLPRTSNFLHKDLIINKLRIRKELFKTKMFINVNHILLKKVNLLWCFKELDRTEKTTIIKPSVIFDRYILLLVRTVG